MDRSLQRSPPKRSNARPSSRWNGRNSDKSYAPDDRQLTSISFSARVHAIGPSTSGLGRLEFVGRKSHGPAAFSRHRNSRLTTNSYRTEGELTLWRILTDFHAKFL